MGRDLSGTGRVLTCAAEKALQLNGTGHLGSAYRLISSPIGRGAYIWRTIACLICSPPGYLKWSGRIENSQRPGPEGDVLIRRVGLPAYGHARPYRHRALAHNVR